MNQVDATVKAIKRGRPKKTIAETGTRISNIVAEDQKKNDLVKVGDKMLMPEKEDNGLGLKKAVKTYKKHSKESTMKLKPTELINYDEFIPHMEYENINGVLMHPCRVIVCGGSGCGKTMSILNMLLTPDLKLDYLKIWIIAKDIIEDKYQWIIKHFEKKEKEIEEATGEKIKVLYYSNKLEDLPDLNSFDDKDPTQKVVIIDDFTNEPAHKLQNLNNYFVMGRKKNFTTFFLNHSWFMVPKTSRLNVEYVMIFRCKKAREVSGLWGEIAGDLPKEVFKKAYRLCTQKNHTFMLIDNKTNDLERKYRKLFDGKLPFVVKALAAPPEEDSDDCSEVSSSSENDN